jgi:hypothetical protein
VTGTFSNKVQTIVGPLLHQLGFTEDLVDDSADDGGRARTVVYYRGSDSKIQIYWSSREGEINCMIAPISASNVFGLNDPSKKWHYLNEFVEKPDLSLEELVRVLRAERINFQTEESWLKWLRDRIERYFDTAHSAILNMN